MDLVAPIEIGICVEDLDKMVGFYRDVLGCDYVNIHKVPPELSAKASLAAAGYQIVRLQTNTGERIKLVHPKTPPSPAPEVGDILARRGPAFLTFIVADLDAMIQRLAGAGVKLRTGSEKLEVREGVFLCFAEDPEGNFLEFVEYSDIAGYRPDLA